MFDRKNLNWNRSDIKNRFKAALKDTRHTHYIFSCCTQPEGNTSYLPGGTCMIMHQPWSTKATSSVDPSGMGKWSEINIQGKQNRQITIITTYRVCSTTSNTHDDNGDTCFASIYQTRTLDRQHWTPYHHELQHCTHREVPSSLT